MSDGIQIKIDPTPEEKLANLKAQEKKLRAKLEKLRDKQDELSDKGQRRKYRTRILIQAGLALVHKMKADLRADLNTLIKLTSDMRDLKSKTPENEHKTNPSIISMQDKLTNQRQILTQKMENLTTQYFKPYIAAADAAAAKIKDDKKRKRAEKEVSTNHNLLMLLLNGIAQNDFK